MTDLLPSELGRLILGYLEARGCIKSAESLLDEYPELKEVALQRKRGQKVKLRIGDYTLVDMLNDFSHTKEIVHENIENYPSTFSSVKKILSLYEQVQAIINIAIKKQTYPSFQKKQPKISGISGSDAVPGSPCSNISVTVGGYISNGSPEGAQQETSHLLFTVSNSTLGNINTEDTSSEYTDHAAGDKNALQFEDRNTSDYTSPTKRKGSVRKKNNTSPKHNPVIGLDSTQKKFLDTLLSDSTLHAKLADTINKRLEDCPPEYFQSNTNAISEEQRENMLPPSFSENNLCKNTNISKDSRDVPKSSPKSLGLPEDIIRDLSMEFINELVGHHTRGVKRNEGLQSASYDHQSIITSEHDSETQSSTSRLLNTPVPQILPRDNFSLNNSLFSSYNCLDVLPSNSELSNLTFFDQCLKSTFNQNQSSNTLDLEHQSKSNVPASSDNNINSQIISYIDSHNEVSTDLNNSNGQVNSGYIGCTNLKAESGLVPSDQLNSLIVTKDAAQKPFTDSEVGSGVSELYSKDSSNEKEPSVEDVNKLTDLTTSSKEPILRSNINNISVADDQNLGHVEAVPKICKFQQFDSQVETTNSNAVLTSSNLMNYSPSYVSPAVAIPVQNHQLPKSIYFSGTPDHSSNYTLTELTPLSPNYSNEAAIHQNAVNIIPITDIKTSARLTRVEIIPSSFQNESSSLHSEVVQTALGESIITKIPPPVKNQSVITVIPLNPRDPDLIPIVPKHQNVPSNNITEQLNELKLGRRRKNLLQTCPAIPKVKGRKARVASRLRTRQIIPHGPNQIVMEDDNRYGTLVSSISETGKKYTLPNRVSVDVPEMPSVENVSMPVFDDLLQDMPKGKSSKVRLSKVQAAAAKPLSLKRCKLKTKQAKSEKKCANPNTKRIKDNLKKKLESEDLDDILDLAIKQSKEILSSAYEHKQASFRTDKVDSSNKLTCPNDTIINNEKNFLSDCKNKESMNNEDCEFEGFQNNLCYAGKKVNEHAKSLDENNRGGDERVSLILTPQMENMQYLVDQIEMGLIDEVLESSFERRSNENDINANNTLDASKASLNLIDSSQLQSLKSFSMSNVQKRFDSSCNMSPFFNNRNTKGSLSTPRNKTHIRALDFGTPSPRKAFSSKKFCRKARTNLTFGSPSPTKKSSIKNIRNKFNKLFSSSKSKFPMESINEELPEKSNLEGERGLAPRDIKPGSAEFQDLSKDLELTDEHTDSDDDKSRSVKYCSTEINNDDTKIGRKLSSLNLKTPGKVYSEFPVGLCLEPTTPFQSIIISNDPATCDSDLNTPAPASFMATPGNASLLKSYPHGPYSDSSEGTYYQPSERSVEGSERSLSMVERFAPEVESSSLHCEDTLTQILIQTAAKTEKEFREFNQNEQEYLEDSVSQFAERTDYYSLCSKAKNGILEAKETVNFNTEANGAISDEESKGNSSMKSSNLLSGEAEYCCDKTENIVRKNSGTSGCNTDSSSKKYQRKSKSPCIKFSKKKPLTSKGNKKSNCRTIDANLKISDQINHNIKNGDKRKRPKCNDNLGSITLADSQIGTIDNKLSKRICVNLKKCDSKKSDIIKNKQVKKTTPKLVSNYKTLKNKFASKILPKASSKSKRKCVELNISLQELEIQGNIISHSADGVEYPNVTIDYIDAEKVLPRKAFYPQLRKQSITKLPGLTIEHMDCIGPSKEEVGPRNHTDNVLPPVSESLIKGILNDEFKDKSAKQYKKENSLLSVEKQAFTNWGKEQLPTNAANSKTPAQLNPCIEHSLSKWYALGKGKELSLSPLISSSTSEGLPSSPVNILDSKANKSKSSTKEKKNCGRVLQSKSVNNSNDHYKRSNSKMLSLGDTNPTCPNPKSLISSNYCILADPLNRQIKTPALKKRVQKDVKICSPNSPEKKLTSRNNKRKKSHTTLTNKVEAKERSFASYDSLTSSKSSIASSDADKVINVGKDSCPLQFGNITTGDEYLEIERQLEVLDGKVFNSPAIREGLRDQDSELNLSEIFTPPFSSSRKEIKLTPKKSNHQKLSTQVNLFNSSSKSSMLHFTALPETPEKEIEEICKSAVKEKHVFAAFPATSRALNFELQGELQNLNSVTSEIISETFKNTSNVTCEGHEDHQNENCASASSKYSSNEMKLINASSSLSSNLFGCVSDTESLSATSASNSSSNKAKFLNFTNFREAAETTEKSNDVVLPSNEVRDAKKQNYLKDCLSSQTLSPTIELRSNSEDPSVAESDDSGNILLSVSSVFDLLSLNLTTHIDNEQKTSFNASEPASPNSSSPEKALESISTEDDLSPELLKEVSQESPCLAHNMTAVKEVVLKSPEIRDHGEEIENVNIDSKKLEADDITISKKNVVDKGVEGIRRSPRKHARHIDDLSTAKQKVSSNTGHTKCDITKTGIRRESPEEIIDSRTARKYLIAKNTTEMVGEETLLMESQVKPTEKGIRKSIINMDQRVHEMLATKPKNKGKVTIVPKVGAIECSEKSVDSLEDFVDAYTLEKEHKQKLFRKKRKRSPHVDEGKKICKVAVEENDEDNFVFETSKKPRVYNDVTGKLSEKTDPSFSSKAALSFDHIVSFSEDYNTTSVPPTPGKDLFPIISSETKKRVKAMQNCDSNSKEVRDKRTSSSICDISDKLNQASLTLANMQTKEKCDSDNLLRRNKSGVISSKVGNTVTNTLYKVTNLTTAFNVQNRALDDGQIDSVSGESIEPRTKVFGDAPSNLRRSSRTKKQEIAISKSQELIEYSEVSKTVVDALQATDIEFILNKLHHSE